MIDGQTLATIAIVAAAAFYIGYRIRKTLTGSRHGCYGCSKNRPSSPDVVPLQSIGVKRSSKTRS